MGIRFVYLAGPIDFDPTGHKSDWRKEAAEQLKEAGVCSFVPSEAFVWADGTEGYDKVIRINMAALGQSDAMLVHLNDLITVGTVREIQRAADLWIPTVIWISPLMQEKYGRSLYLAGFRQVTRLDTAILLLRQAKNNETLRRDLIPKE